MKLLIFLALLATIVYSLPVDVNGQYQDIEGVPIADLEYEHFDIDGSDVARPKRHFGGQ